MGATRKLARGIFAGVLLLGAGCGGGDGNGDGAAPATTTSAPPTTAGTAPQEPETTSSTSTSAAPAGRVIEVQVTSGEVVGGVRRERVERGEAIVLRVGSDTADEVHVHGYDLKEDVTAGGVAELAFTADIPGVFEVELEERKLKILELEVR